MLHNDQLFRLSPECANHGDTNGEQPLRGAQRNDFEEPLDARNKSGGGPDDQPLGFFQYSIFLGVALRSLRMPLKCPEYFPNWQALLNRSATVHVSKPYRETGDHSALESRIFLGRACSLHRCKMAPPRNHFLADWSASATFLKRSLGWSTNPKWTVS
jgi:hypothetical protein